jgi:prepilin-type N-terminal cleavage/methylation domain-containing protein
MFVGRQQGNSLLELILAVAIAAVLLTMALRLAIWNSVYKQEKNLAQVQEYVAELLAGLNAYYYATCQTSPEPEILSCNRLVVAGGITQKQCDAINNNRPWGVSFTMNILEPVTNPPFFQLQVQGTFGNYSGDMNKLAALLNADAYVGDQQLTWTRLPNNSITNQGIWYRTPGNYMAATNVGEIGGNHFASGMWIMKAGLAQFAKSQPVQQTANAPCAD